MKFIDYLKRFDYLSFIAMILLIAMGGVFIKSAGAARSSLLLQNLWQTHLATAGFAIALYFVLSMLDWRKIFDFGAVPVYAASLAMLVLVLVAGTDRFGGKRWLWFFQPSEIGKFAVVLLLAHVFGHLAMKNPDEHKHSAGTDDEGETLEKPLPLAGFKGFLVATGIIGVPALLILVEPDLGTALVLAPASIVMLFAAKVWLRGVATLVILAAVAAGLVLGTIAKAESLPPAEQQKIYSRLPFKKHQISRLRIFVNPDADPYGSGWTLNQAKIAIGSGSFAGKGIGKGDQKRLGYLPPSVSMNDFIFAVLAEEAGFAGAAAMLTLFAVIVLRGLWTAAKAADGRGRLFAVGISTIIFFHVYENVAMSIGLMPITGLPLPFISAGRTFLVALVASLGVMQSINIRAYQSSETERN